MKNTPQADPPARQQVEDTPSQIERDMVKWTKAVAWFTGLLFLANIATNFFIYQQWRVANDAQVDTRAQLRAVVTFTGGTILVTNDKDGKPVFYSFFGNFQNFGGTRTARFTAWDSISFFEGDVPNNVDFTRPLNKIDPANNIIGPNSPFQMPPVTVSQQVVDRVIAKQGIIIAWGRAEYADIFDPETTHHITFCFQMSPTTATNTGQMVFQPVPFRNDCNSNK